MQNHSRKSKNQLKTILSLFDFSGTWSAPYKQAGYNVIRHDLKFGQDIFTDTLSASNADYVEGNSLHGILAALPCTDFAVSGARWFADKDAYNPFVHDTEHISFMNTTEMYVMMALIVLHIVEMFKNIGLQWWVIEQPISRLHKLVPEVGKPRMYFQPCEFGHPYTKKTALYGEFNTILKRTPVPPIFGSMMHSNYGGKSEKTKTMRSMTPTGFAKAFFEANP